MRVLNGRDNRIEQWGARQMFRGPWRENDNRALIFKPAFKVQGGYCVPQSQSLLLTAQYPAGLTGGPGSNFAFRWFLSVGGGGGQAHVKFDMLNTQQVSIAGENINVQVLCERYETGGASPVFQANDTMIVDASASLADGNVSSGQATYTQAFQVAAGSSTTLLIPEMASSWRMLGQDGAASYPLVATVSVRFATNSSGGVIYDASKLSQYTTGYLDIPGGNTGNVTIVNPSGNVLKGLIQWGLDL